MKRRVRLCTGHVLAAFTTGTTGALPPSMSPSLPANKIIQDIDAGGYVLYNVYCVNNNANPSPTMASFTLVEMDPSPPTPPFTFNPASKFFMHGGFFV